MKWLLLILCSGLVSCAHVPSKYTPREPCPDLPELKEHATQAESDAWTAQIILMYGQCKKARRVCPHEKELAK
jgi:hypothetical protein